MSSPMDKEAILYAFAIEPQQDRATLERYLRQYPELSADLIDLSSELRLGDAVDMTTASTASRRDWKAAWQRFQACKPEQESGCDVVNPFSLFRGTAFVKLAETLNVPRSFLTAFRDGLVVASSIPDQFARRFADATSVTFESAREFFARPQTALLVREFKSEDKPSHQGQKTFEELVHSSDLTEEQRQLLLKDLDDDGLNRGKPATS
jgi:hypothetical protein